jgi:hypothetical protein
VGRLYEKEQDLSIVKDVFISEEKKCSAMCGNVKMMRYSQRKNRISTEKLFDRSRCAIKGSRYLHKDA